jgi:alkylated DNA repair dioxygenase AlkB
MGFAVQTSLVFDEPLAAGSNPGVAWQSGLGAVTSRENGGSLEFASLGGVERIPLSDGAWVEIRRAWLRGGFALLEGLLGSSDWVSERRRMYDRVVDTPRLLRFYRTGEVVPWAELAQARSILSEHYFDELGEEFTSTGMCLYRDGRDSVAWHGDTIGRGATEDTVVAIVSLGASRSFALRPRSGGGPSMRFTLDHGDLIVMGGSCQRTWEHALPKTAKNVGPRISVQFRPSGVS